MKTQKIINLINDTDNESSKFAKKKKKKGILLMTKIAQNMVRK